MDARPRARNPLCRVTLGSLWGHFCFTLGSLWCHFGLTLGSLWGHFRTSPRVARARLSCFSHAVSMLAFSRETIDR
eukprot:5108600-Heterocapsa_arctica.AAC.1